MKINIKIILFLSIVISTLNAFQPSVYKCYNGGRNSIFTLNEMGSVLQKEYTSRRYRGVWIDFGTEAEITIQSNKIIKYLISPDKNGDENMFIIYKVKNNRDYRFCKAEKVQNNDF